jgi:hypothetical protein
LLVAIPIAVFKIIVAGTASSSPFQRRPKIDRHHAGILFTFRWNLRSRCAGNREHHAPEHALRHQAALGLEVYSLKEETEMRLPIMN